jgi:hypothetical protein
MTMKEGSRRGVRPYVGPCICPHHDGETCHRKRRHNRKLCSGCIDLCPKPWEEP